MKRVFFPSCSYGEKELIHREKCSRSRESFCALSSDRRRLCFSRRVKQASSARLGSGWPPPCLWPFVSPQRKQIADGWFSFSPSFSFKGERQSGSPAWLWFWLFLIAVAEFSFRSSSPKLFLFPPVGKQKRDVVVVLVRSFVVVGLTAKNVEERCKHIIPSISEQPKRLTSSFSAGLFFENLKWKKRKADWAELRGGERKKCSAFACCFFFLLSTRLDLKRKQF